MVNRVLRGMSSDGKVDLEAAEKALREMGQRVSSSLLEKLLNARRGSLTTKVVCNKKHQARFIDRRPKGLLTVVGKIRLEREYHYCAQCRKGVIPDDRELDIEGTLISPGVRRMAGLVGAKESFDEGRRDLEELAGLKISTKTLERIAEAIGADIELKMNLESELAMSDKLAWLKPEHGVNRMYIEIDGTGLPMISREMKGRKGKGIDGNGKTREAKLGCVFTQTGVDSNGRPVRDESSTSYVGAIETAEQFGPRIYAEAIRRGIREAKEVVVIGDAASWIWKLAAKNFWGATQIVDLYHALEHLSDAAKAAYGASSPKAKQWILAHQDELKDGNIESVLKSLSRLRPSGLEEKETVRKTIGYFRENRERMRYSEFRKRGLFVGSGVVEAGCKTIMGRRLKQSGMKWTVRGANSIIALRCCQVSGRWEDYWEARSIA